MPLDLNMFYHIASQKEQVLRFPTEKEAIKFRLRLYSIRRGQKGKLMPELTILIRGNELIAGPKGFDLIAEMPQETIQAMEEASKKEMEELDEMFKTLEKDKVDLKKLEQVGLDAMATLGFGVGKKGQKLEDKLKAHAQQVFDPYATYTEELESEKDKNK